MSRTSKSASKKSSSKAKKASKTSSVKPLYPVSKMKKSTSAKLWVSYPKGNTSNAYVYSSTLSRDAVRNATRKLTGATAIDGIRARRVSSYRKLVG